MIYLLKRIECASPFPNMYYTDTDMFTEVQDGYCLYYHTYAKVTIEYSLQHHLHTYCFRSNKYLKENLTTNRPFILFSQLREQHVTSEQLYSWSTPIDLAERYEMYLLNISQNNSLMDSIRLYNCTDRYTFGPLCQFQTAVLQNAFIDIVGESMEIPFVSPEDLIIFSEYSPCYINLDCDYIYSSPLCLTWRDICDGKVHCRNNAIDEHHCFELELNQCNENEEYRCHNGQCIPYEFFHDIPQFPDCLDRSDEILDYSSICFTEPSMRCEDHHCRLDSGKVNCGDGQCNDTHCSNGYFDRLKTSIRSPSNDTKLLPDCWKAIEKLASIYTSWMDDMMLSLSIQNSYINKIRKFCPPLFAYPAYPIALGHVYFVYTSNQSNIDKYMKYFLPTYICYNETLCPGMEFLSQFPRPIYFSIDSRKNSACHELKFISMINVTYLDEWSELQELIEIIYSNACPSVSQTFDNLDKDCSTNSHLYQCEKSRKCISKFRILDGVMDCPLDDDETYEDTCSLTKTHHQYQCKINGVLKCVSPMLYFKPQFKCTKSIPNIDNVKPNKFSKFPNNSLISFQTLCDGFVERDPLSYEYEYETDETNCDYDIWPCNNTYTYCDGFWNCENGFDELHCPWQYKYDPENVLCNEFQHVCVSPDNYELICVDLSDINDGHVDCLGATDERYMCRRPASQYLCLDQNACITVEELCDGKVDCSSKEDEGTMCSKAVNADSLSVSYLPLCSRYMLERSPIANIVCSLDKTDKPTVVHFSLKNFAPYPRTISFSSKSFVTLNELRTMNENKDVIRASPMYRRSCHRGLPIWIRSGLPMDFSRDECLCPPAYYGSRCQYENQRIALTIQFQVDSEWRTLFTFFVLLIDNENTVHSHEKLSYISIRDCNAKFHIYLLYNSRPKNQTKTYHIRIHSFLGLTSEYRMSWLYPIQFSFLPVHRLSLLLKIPQISNKDKKCSLNCGLHGECIQYENHPISVCRCHSGWHGINCDIPYECSCADDSFCIESSKICLCPLHKFGSRCYLKQSICQQKSSPCLHGGTCIPHDIRFIGYTKPYTCLCSENFFGDQCQHKKSLIELSIRNEMSDVSNILSMHYIIVDDKRQHEVFSTAIKIRFDRSSIEIYTSRAFNILIIELTNHYYLMSVLPNVTYFDRMKVSLTTSQRCLHIKEIFSQTVIEYHPLRRAKYYHLACREKRNLKCFHDSDTFMCLCTSDRHANCLNFNFTTKHYKCRNRNYCLNNGQCFQDHIQCPATSVCSCIGCFYGTLCQFSTEGVRLSLDSILGYHIRTTASIMNQPQIVKISFAIVIVIFILGVIGGVCSMITFAFTPNARDNGCGIYILTLSIINLLIMHVFLIKFLLLFFTQNGSMTQVWVLQLNCKFIDYIVRILVNIADWLNACIATDRTMMIISKTKFNAKRSKNISKWIILLVIIISATTAIQDPLNRYLLYVEDDKKTWCVSHFNSRPMVQRVDSILHVIHYIIPFSINIISSIIIIVLTSRVRYLLVGRTKLNENLRKHMRHYSHLIISPCLLVLLALPRILIVLRSSCVKSLSNPHFPLFGYFISFVSPALIFIIYVVPSMKYRNNFKDVIGKFMKICLRR
ncbi:unnamed protein product [Adineta ricciae]|uniref:Uncharacterized protein n=1 Tax=Adineta ricciae TaxID=249248 RepID=A0A814Y052_ADIRI|nr:unnamed protein product [Adineta ricciae]CAF1223333.1 unnamed protein product [Adineta ricciae]